VEFQRISKRLRLQQSATLLGAEVEWIRTLRQGRLISVNDQFQPKFAGSPVAELDRLGKFEGSIHVQEHERNPGGRKSLLREPQQHRRILAGGVQQRGPLKLGGRLPQDVDSFGFQSVHRTVPGIYGQRLVNLFHLYLV